MAPGTGRSKTRPTRRSPIGAWRQRRLPGGHGRHQQAGLWTWRRDRELAALRGDKAAAEDETPDRALAKALEFLEKGQ